MTLAQFNAIYVSISFQGVRYQVVGNQHTMNALRKRGYVDKYNVVTFDGLLAALEACLQSNRSNDVKKLEITRLSAAISRFNLQAV